MKHRGLLKQIMGLGLILASPQLAYSQVLPEATENQCRTEAKEIALKSYESCITIKKTEHIEQLRQEYQAKLLELKNEYDQKIKDLANSNSTQTNLNLTPIPEPTQQKVRSQQKTKSSKSSKTKSKNKSAISSNKSIHQQPNTLQTEPTVKLRKAKASDMITPQTNEETMTARVEEEINSITGEMEKLELQEETGQ